MTYSIVAWDPATGELGVAVATCHLAVGALVPHARAGAGAVATQASTNPHYGRDALDLLAGGSTPEDVVRRLTAPDRGRDHRQLHLVDTRGRAAAWTGAAAVPWAGHRSADNLSAAGNMLAGPQVIDALLRAAQESPGLALPERLLQALEAAEAAGGDKRGRMSAALYVVAHERYPAVDLRVDFAAAPLPALRQLLDEHGKTYVQRFRAALPTHRDPGRSVSDVADSEP